MTTTLNDMVARFWTSPAGRELERQEAKQRSDDRQTAIDEIARLEAELLGDEARKLQQAAEQASQRAEAARLKFEREQQAAAKAANELRNFRASRDVRIAALGRELSDTASPLVETFRQELLAEAARLRHHGREVLRGMVRITGELREATVSNSDAVAARLRAVMNAVSEQIPALSRLADAELPEAMQQIRGSFPECHGRWNDLKLAATILDGDK